MTPVSLEKVVNFLSTLKEEISSIGIPNKLIKIAAEELAVPLTNIFNNSITSGIVPDIFKISRIAPIYKSDDPSDPNNYSPVAVLSSFSKIFEKNVYEQLLTFIDKHNIPYKYQFGFRKNYSTEQAILEITDKLQKTITCGH